MNLLSIPMQHDFTVPLKEYTHQPTDVKACAIWCITIHLVLQGDHRNESFSSTYGSGRNRMKIYFSLETSGNGILSIHKHHIPNGTAILWSCLRFMTSRGEMWQVKKNNKYSVSSIGNTQGRGIREIYTVIVWSVYYCVDQCYNYSMFKVSLTSRSWTGST